VAALVVVVDSEEEGSDRAGQPADYCQNKHKEHRPTAPRADAAGEGWKEDAQENVNTTHIDLKSFRGSVVA